LMAWIVEGLALESGDIRIAKLSNGEVEIE
jgi:hypothetical protein